MLLGDSQHEPEINDHKKDALISYKLPTIPITQNSRLLELPAEILNVIAAQSKYTDSISLKNTCKKLHRILDIPTIEGFFETPHWWRNSAIRNTLVRGLGHRVNQLPCHLCKRFLDFRNFATIPWSHSMMRKGKLLKTWCLDCGFAAGYYVKGQVVRYAARRFGCFCKECGHFITWRGYCDLASHCGKCSKDEWCWHAGMDQDGLHYTTCGDCGFDKWLGKFTQAEAPSRSLTWKS